MDRVKVIRPGFSVACDFDQHTELEVMVINGSTGAETSKWLTLAEVVELQHHLAGVLVRYSRRKRLTKE